MLPNDYKEEWYLKLKLLYETPYVISHLTDEPNGQLDVQAFIDKKDHCWEVLDTTKKNEKKTLILTSWCFQHLNHFRGLINFLVDLIEDNFAIYMPQEDTLVNIKESFFSELAAFTPITTQKARLMAARVSLSNDKIDIINLQRLRELARQIKETTPYGVYKLPREGDIYDANRPLNLSSDQIRVIEEAIDPDDEIHYVFQKDTAPFLHPVKQHIKTLKINDNLSTEEVDFIALVAPSLETLIFSSCGVFSTNLPCLKTLVLSGSTLSSAQLSTLLKMTPNLENLTINYCPNLTGQSLTLDSEQLRNLKTLSTFSALNSVQLASLLEVTCQLEELYIMDNDHGEPGNCFFSTHQLTPQLKNLKVLTMSQSTLSLLTLANILQSTPQLEKIQLYRALKMGSDHLQLPSLNRLKTVSLTCDSLTSYQLSEMIASAPYVENLTISCLNSHGTPLNLRRTQLSHLKELRIDSTPCLYSEQFFTIIANASNLEKLEISFHDSIGESIPSVKLGQLEHLKSVEIGNQPFTLKQFHILLNAAHYIESLTIHFSKFKYLLELQPGQLPRLQYFNISWSEVTPNELSALLAAAPHLVLLELFDCANLGVGKRSLCLRANHITQLRNIALDKMAKKIRQLSQESEVSGFYFNGKDREQIPPDQNTHLIDGQLSTDEPRTFESKQLFKGHAGHAPDTRIYHLQSLRFVRPFLYREYVPTLETLEKTNAVIFPSAQKIRDSFENTDNYNTKYHFYGQTTLTGLKPHTWNQLPALSVSDRLLGYFSNLHSEYEIRWDNTSGYYYIKVSKPSSGIISYVIESKPEFTIAQDSSPESLMTLMKSLQFQSDGTLIKNKAYTYLKTRPCDELIYALTQFCTFPNSAIKKITGSPMDIFNQLIKIRTGACRHRAKLFVALASELGLTASLIQNKAHSFVTVLDETRVCRAIDLGGIPVRIVEMEMPDLPEEIIVTPDNPFQTWNTQPLKARDMTSLAVELKCQSFQRHLVILDNEEAIEALHTAVVDKSMRCFFIANLDSLTLRALKAQDNSYEIVDSALAAFLKEAARHPKEERVWFINWSNPRPEHVGFNSIIDDIDRRLNTLPIPPNVRIISVMDKLSASTMGEDFSSRFDAISQVPGITGPTSCKPDHETSVRTEPDDVLLTTSYTWQKELIGSYQINGQETTFIPGALLRAINAQAKALSIQNAPWENAEFRYGMTKILKTKRVFANGTWHPLPEFLNITFAQPLFSYPSLKKSSSKAKELVLNSLTYPHFFPHQRIGSSGIELCAGLLEYQTAIRLCVTDNLSNAQWYTLWQEAMKNHCTLELQCIPNVIVPKELNQWMVASKKLQPQPPARLIITNDIDKAEEPYPDAVHIPIHLNTRFECLFSRVSRQDKGFSHEETSLLKAIRADKSIVLKGTFSKTLGQRLQSLFLNPGYLYINGERIEIKNSIVLISENETAFVGIENDTIVYDPETYFKVLKTSLATSLKTAYTTLKITPCYSHFIDLPHSFEHHAAWVTNKIEQLKASVGELTYADAPTTPEDVLNYLSMYPFVFLQSGTGAGKSYFVDHILPHYFKLQRRDVSIHHGLDSVKTWAKSAEGFLFIDEANLSFEQFNLFDNVAHGKHEIWIDGNYYPLSPQHKVIFAGNPKQYEGRLEASLFKRFPYYLGFKGQELATILQPLLDFFDYKNDLLAMIENYYQKALDAKVTITPRNAQMICLTAFILKQLPLTQHMPETFLMQYAIAHELKSLTPMTMTLIEEKKEDTAIINQALASLLPLLPHHDFIWTPSRINIAITIQTLLIIRERKLNHNADQAVGINGIVLEGEPGLGKSRLLINLLKAQNIPYVIISTNSPDIMRHQLMDAFHAGKVAVVDELNSFPDELFLNSLLSGTDLKGNPPENPGFCLLASQNPITYKNRAPLSKALSNRLLKLNLSRYPQEELCEILENKFKLTPEFAVELTKKFNSARSYAEQQRLFPLPNTRAIFKQAEQEILPPPLAGYNRTTWM